MALVAQHLLTRLDRMNGQQAPELEVLDHRKLLQALRKTERTEVRATLYPAKACPTSQA